TNQLDCKLTLYSTDRLLHVVRDGLGESPFNARDLLNLSVQGCDEFLFVSMELLAPLLSGFKVDEVLGVEEARGVGAVIGPAHLRDNLSYFRESGEGKACLVHDPFAFIGAGAG